MARAGLAHGELRRLRGEGGGRGLGLSGVVASGPYRNSPPFPSARPPYCGRNNIRSRRGAAAALIEDGSSDSLQGASEGGDDDELQLERVAQALHIPPQLVALLLLAAHANTEHLFPRHPCAACAALRHAAARVVVASWRFMAKAEAAAAAVAVRYGVGQDSPPQSCS